EGKKWVSYGDSITSNGGWQLLVANTLKLNHTKMGLVSSMIVNDSTWAIPLCDDTRLNAIPSDTDVITIMGGTNDWAGRKNIGTIADTTRDTYYGAYKYIIESIQTRIPTCRIILICPPFGYYNAGLGNGELNNVGKTTRDFGNAVKELGQYYGLPVIDMRGNQGVNKINKDTLLVLEDVQVHMTVEGNKRFAGVVLGGFNNINSY
ncbi:MAG: SGNH/GDSL hydrolase family protein, partial [Clostridium sp.]